MDIPSRRETPWADIAGEYHDYSPWIYDIEDSGDMPSPLSEDEVSLSSADFELDEHRPGDTGSFELTISRPSSFSSQTIGDQTFIAAAGQHINIADIDLRPLHLPAGEERVMTVPLMREPTRNIINAKTSTPTRPLSPGPKTSRQNEHTLWRHPYLRRRILVLFLVCFALFSVTTEILLTVSDRNRGLANSQENLHYAWTYVPTAVLTVTAGLWSRVD